MKRFLKTFLPLIILGTLAYQFRAPILSFLNPVPCEEPISYVLGTFDEKFNISKKYFLNTLLEAEAVFEKPLGKNLFTYEPDNSSGDVLKINLIYDYRQEATTKLASLGIVVEDNRASYDKLKAKFTALKAEYEKEKSIFATRVEAFNKRAEAYEAEVDFWNKKGARLPDGQGAPQKEYEALQATGRELENESKELQAMQNRINNIADEINALVVALNRLVATLNLSVDKYNTTNDARGESFEEGVYVSDGYEREIDVYEFSNREKLLRVLAHEFGHALDLEHVDDPKAIMYKLNQGNSKTLSEADLEALKTKCGIK